MSTMGLVKVEVELAGGEYWQRAPMASATVTKSLNMLRMERDGSLSKAGGVEAAKD